MMKLLNILLGLLFIFTSSLAIANDYNCGDLSKGKNDKAITATNENMLLAVITNKHYGTLTSFQGQDNRRGCCSWHSGVCGCSNGRAVCCDNTLSPSCGCD